MYQVLTASIVPRPIAWVSTVSADGVANLAPYSFFSVSSTHPPVVQFTSVTRKDSLRNIEATGEFVINVATEPLISTVNASSATFDSEVDEFAALGIDTEPSERVRPARVAGSPVAIETMLQFAARHKVTPTTEHMPMSRINEAFERLEAGKARYRIVLNGDF